LPKGDERILLVEDEDHVRLLAHRVLASCGYHVVATRDGAQALEWIQSGEHCDAVVSDVVMPKMTGPQLAAQLAALDPMPVMIFMSGYTDDAIAKFELAPEQVLLRKPFTPFTLARAVRDALDLAKVAR
jgi:CheY-like chemotaxis protein